MLLGGLVAFESRQPRHHLKAQVPDVRLLPHQDAEHGEYERNLSLALTGEKYTLC